MGLKPKGDINTNSLIFQINKHLPWFATFKIFVLCNWWMEWTIGSALNFPLETFWDDRYRYPECGKYFLSCFCIVWANAFNGILLCAVKVRLNTKASVFRWNVELPNKMLPDNPYTDFSMRAAYKFSEKFAESQFGYLRGTDWAANNLTGKPGTGETRSDIDYDGSMCMETK